MSTVESFELGYISPENDRGNRNVRAKDEELRRKENPVKGETPTCGLLSRWEFSSELIDGVVYCIYIDVKKLSAVVL